MDMNKIKQIQNRIKGRIKKDRTLLIIYTKAGLMMFIVLLLITNTISNMLDIYVLLIGSIFLGYFILFGYKYLI